MKTLNLDDIKEIEKVKEDYLFIDAHGNKIYSEVNAQKINAYNKLFSNEAIDVAKNITFNADGEVADISNGVKAISPDRFFSNRYYIQKETLEEKQEETLEESKKKTKKEKPTNKLVIVAGMFSNENYLSIKASGGMIPYKQLTAHTLVRKDGELVVEKVELISDEDFNNNFKDTLPNADMIEVVNAIIKNRKSDAPKGLKELGI